MPIWRGAPSAHVTAHGRTKIDGSLLSLLDQPLAATLVTRPGGHILGDAQHAHADRLDVISGGEPQLRCSHLNLRKQQEPQPSQARL